MTDDPYSFWRRAIALTEGKRSLTRDEQRELVVTEEPGCGFFKRRTMRAGPFVPVAIFFHGDAMVAVQDGKAVAPEDVWTYACPHPITEADYHHYTKTGQWPGEDMAVRESLEGRPPKAPTLGDNLPPAETPDQEIARQIEAASANLDSYRTITTDEQAQAAQSVRSRLLELSGSADRHREEAKKPHLEAGRVVDALWQPIVKMGKDRAEALRAAMRAYETKKLNEAAEARRKAEEEARTAAEQAKAKGEAPAPAPAPEPPAPAPPTTVRGNYGRAASVRTVKQAKVTDPLAFATFVLSQPEHSASRQELVGLLDKLADRAVKAGLSAPGTEVEEIADVR